MAKIEINIDDIYEHLSISEKQEMITLIIENGDFLNSVYDSFGDDDKERLSDKLEKDGYFENDSGPDIEYDNKNKLNNALLSLFDKSHMLTKFEIHSILNIANEYKHF
jgi:hypothetical protein